MGSQTWSERYRQAVEQLGSSQEARWLLEATSGSPWPDCLSQLASEEALATFDRLVARRRQGEPLQYVLGQWAFRTLELTVDQRVLIPRPETEVVVDVALAAWDALGGGPAVDLGCGSGAIALSLAAERPGRPVWGTDVSADALAVASANLERLEAATVTDATTTAAGAGSARPHQRAVHLVQGVWWSALPAELRGSVALVVSNPPYIAEREWSTLEPQVRDWEPAEALVAGPTGLEAVATILAEAPSWLSRPAAAVVEIAPHQAASAALLARAAGFSAVQVRPDLTGRERVLVGRIEP